MDLKAKSSIQMWAAFIGQWVNLLYMSEIYYMYFKHLLCIGNKR